ncbi:hypothetical protein C8Q77DRAFT_1070554 [Trametes polyzona]|nr:hypothetical protein C8Q77DRAFT_1070554 [Trametes polyzona]
MGLNVYVYESAVACCPDLIALQHLSDPITTETWARFCDRARWVRSINGRSELSPGSWSFLLRHSGNVPVFSLLEELRWRGMSHPFSDLRLLSSHALHVLVLHCPQGIQDQLFVSALEDLLGRASRLLNLTLYDSSADLPTRLRSQGLRHLQDLTVGVSIGAYERPVHRYVNTGSLRAIAALPHLEALQIDLNVDRAAEPPIEGFDALKVLKISDNRLCAQWLLERWCLPHLRSLHLNYVSLPHGQSPDWVHLHPLLTLVARRLPELRTFDLHINCFRELPGQFPEVFLSAVEPLLPLRQLITVNMLFYRREILVSDAVLQASAEALPTLVFFSICFDSIADDENARGLHKEGEVTLRALASFAKHCPKLEVLHVPWLIYKPPVRQEALPSQVHQQEGRANTVTSARTEHGLRELAICWSVVQEVQLCAMAVDTMFPRIDTGKSRTRSRHCASGLAPRT